MYCSFLQSSTTNKKGLSVSVISSSLALSKTTVAITPLTLSKIQSKKPSDVLSVIPSQASLTACTASSIQPSIVPIGSLTKSSKVLPASSIAFSMSRTDAPTSSNPGGNGRPNIGAKIERSTQSFQAPYVPLSSEAVPVQLSHSFVDVAEERPPMIFSSVP